MKRKKQHDHHTPYTIHHQQTSTPPTSDRIDHIILRRDGHIDFEGRRVAYVLLHQLSGGGDVILCVQSLSAPQLQLLPLSVLL